jgi:hypothetical protein
MKSKLVSQFAIVFQVRVTIYRRSLPNIIYYRKVFAHLEVLMEVISLAKKRRLRQLKLVNEDINAYIKNICLKEEVIMTTLSRKE